MTEKEMTLILDTEKNRLLAVERAAVHDDIIKLKSDVKWLKNISYITLGAVIAIHFIDPSRSWPFGWGPFSIP